jgi:hypothetical protein
MYLEAMKNFHNGISEAQATTAVAFGSDSWLTIVRHRAEKERAFRQFAAEFRVARFAANGAAANRS